MAPEYDDVAELTRELAERVRTSGPGIISVDGWTGSGKSTFAKTVAECIGSAYLSLDDYLDRNHGGYLERLDYPKLKADLSGLLARSRPVLVEGIRVLEVLDRIDERPGLKIYVRRVDPDGVWHDGFQLESSAEEVIEREREDLRKMLEAKGKQLDERSEPLGFEVIRYHYNYRPHETGDMYFNRIERPA